MLNYTTKIIKKQLKINKEHDIEETLLFSLIKQGNKFNSNLISKSTYFDLIQLNLKTISISTRLILNIKY